VVAELTASPLVAAAALSEVRPGRLADVPFLLRQIEAGVASGHFSAMLATPHGRLMLVGWCCRAILRRIGVGRRGVAGWDFQVVRIASTTIGAVLSEITVEAGEPVTWVGYVVVEQARRRQSVAKRLVAAVIEQAPASRIMCACAPASKKMMRLLQGLGFKLRRRAPELPGLVAPLLFEYRKPPA
jgi:GNAT superfamily N-acetyltransferase